MSLDFAREKFHKAQAAEVREQAVVLCRSALNDIIDTIYDIQASEKPVGASMLELIDGPVVSTYVGDVDILNAMHYVRIIGMNAQHGESIRIRDKKISLQNISAIIEYIESKQNNRTYIKPVYMSEYATRKIYVDTYIKEAGWTIQTKEDLVQPGTAGIEIKIDGLDTTASGFGYADYVLYDVDAKPLAIVEVKKTTKDPAIGRHQVDSYAVALSKKYGYKPIMYYTNGYVTKIIDGIYPDRIVRGFHSLEDLQLLMSRRNRQPINNISINDNITNRYYQKTAITATCEHFNKNMRKALIVMATGTGKTRLAVSLVDILAKNNWVKNVLFLADRTSLVSQANGVFEKLLPDFTSCEISAGGEKDYNARLMFSTYQTMINYIDAETKKFSIGRFDLIIIDEAHRSIFNKYGSIFAYFDSFLVGLTATPKNEVDANTYSLFGCEAGVPNFDYSLEQAVKDGYLVSYNVLNRTSKLLTSGVEVKDLTPQQKQQLEEYFAEKERLSVVDPEDEEIKGNEFFRKLYNKDTCRRVLSDLMASGYRVDLGETLGKTIIFAYNHIHAQQIVDCFHELYPNLPANTCQLVDNKVKYADDLVRKFGTDPEFRIAVSVDMLDTGIDVPEILNLVFFKPVKSKIKFMQMIGRGTRLCENIYGPGAHKDGFLIFDYCGNFEYFNKHPEGTVPKEQVTATQLMFNIRLEILRQLQDARFQVQDWYQNYYKVTKDELYQQVAKLKACSNRIQVREEMEYVDHYVNTKVWESLSAVNVKQLQNHLSKLVDKLGNDDYKMLAFDICNYVVELSLLKSGTVDNSVNSIKAIRKALKFLMNEKASVPAVKAKLDLLLKYYDEDFWKNVTVETIEKERKELRDLMIFCVIDSGRYIVDITDDISGSRIPQSGSGIDIRTYKEKVIDYLADHLDNKPIQKIRNIEPIDMDDLKELEYILWQELGTKEDYQNTTTKENLAAFVRSLIGLDQDAVNEKFGQYLDGSKFNSMQQEYIHTIIEYVRQNGDIERGNIVETDPFSDYDPIELFGTNVGEMLSVVDHLHNVIRIA